MSLGRFQFRRDVAVNWSTQNPVLLEGELGLETDTRQFKIGNGVTAWSSLPYGGIEGGIGPQGEQGPAGPAGPVGTPETLQPLIDSAAQSAASAGDSAALAEQRATASGESAALAENSATASDNSATAAASSATDAANSATSSTSSATAAAASAAEAENAKDIAVAAFDASNVYETIALGRAAVLDGEFFWVRPGGSDGLATPTLYRRDSSTTQTLVYEQPTIGPGLTQVPTNADLRVDSMLDLVSLTAPTIAGVGIEMRSFYSNTNTGGGRFYWDINKSKASHNGGTIIDPDHSITPGNTGWWTSENTGNGCWVKQEKDTMSIAEFGAVSGVDSADAVQATIDSVEIGRIVTLGGDGESFPLGKTINVNKSVTIRGSGNSEDTAIRGTQLIKKAAVNGPQFNVTKQNVTLEGFLLTGETNNLGHGIQVSNGRFVASNVTIVRMGGNGLQIGDSNVGTNCNIWRLNNVISRKNLGHGIRIADEDAAHAGEADVNAGVAVGLELSLNEGDGLSIGSALRNDYINVTVQANTGRGIHIEATAQEQRFFGGDQDEGNTGGNILNEGIASAFFGVTDAGFTDNGTETLRLTRVNGGLKKLGLGGIPANQERLRISEAFADAATIMSLVSKGNAAAGRGYSVDHYLPISGGTAVGIRWESSRFSTTERSQQKVYIHNGTSLTHALTLDIANAANGTALLLRDADSGVVGRVKVGANGTGPGGVGRALYLDNIV